MLSPVFRAQLFFAVNLTAGWKAAVGAMMAEFAYRSLSAGFYGALTQCFRGAEPLWLAGVTVAIVLPVLSHSLELLIHWYRGTPHLWTSIGASAAFTGVSTVFNWYAMRKGVFVVGEGSASLGADLRRIPRVLGGFFAAGAVAIWHIGCECVSSIARIPGRDPRVWQNLDD